MSLYLLFGQYHDWTSFQPEESSLNAAGTASSSSGAEPTAHWDWGPVASAAPEQHWDSWGFPVVEPAPEQPASALSAEALPHQDVPLVPKAASHVVAPSDAVWDEAPGTPPGDAAMPLHNGSIESPVALSKRTSPKSSSVISCTASLREWLPSTAWFTASMIFSEAFTSILDFMEVVRLDIQRFGRY